MLDHTGQTFFMAALPGQERISQAREGRATMQRSSIADKCEPQVAWQTYVTLGHAAVPLGLPGATMHVGLIEGIDDAQAGEATQSIREV